MISGVSLSLHLILDHSTSYYLHAGLNIERTTFIWCSEKQKKIRIKEYPMSERTKKLLISSISLIGFWLALTIILTFGSALATFSPLTVSAQGLDPAAGNPDFFTEDGDPYPAPTELQASDGTFMDKIRVIWESLVKADFYQVFRATSEAGQKTLIGTASDTILDDPNVEAESTYYYWVKACDLVQCSDFSAFDTGWRALNIPAIPTNVQASDGAFSDRVRVTWDEDENAIYYEVYRADSPGGEKALIRTVTGPPVDDPDVVIETPYYYWVKACNVDGCSDFSVYDSGYRSLPAAPENVQASDGTYVERVRVTWDSSFGANFYELYRAESPTGTKTLIGTVTSPDFNDVTAAYETTYYYWVKGCVIDACSGFSDFDSGWRSLPAVPENVQASDGTYLSKILITWDEVSSAKFDELYRAESPTGEKELIGTPATPEFDDTDVLVETLYYYWVKACVLDACSALSDFDSGYRSLPAVPQNLSASDGTYLDKVLITWDAVSGATYYELYRADSPGGEKSLLDSPTLTQYEDTSALVDELYYYWVKACNAEGCSAFSEFDTGYRGLPGIPQNVQASDGTYPDKILVTWDSTTGATYYKLYRAESLGGDRTLIASPTSTSYDDADVEMLLEYYYWVQACNNSGCSADSEPDSGWMAEEQAEYRIHTPLILHSSGSNPVQDDD